MAQSQTYLFFGAQMYMFQFQNQYQYILKIVYL